MEIIDIFEKFAADFEVTVQDDDWSRLEKYFAKDATYLNVGSPDPKCIGRKEIIEFLKSDVSNTDRRFDSRTLIPLTSPKTEGNRLSRSWRCIYTLAGAQDLIVEGEARYLFEKYLIKELEEELTAASMQKLAEWIQENGERLHAQQFEPADQ